MSQIHGNEFAQAVRLSVVGGEQLWVANVYLPPANALVKRSVHELEARQYVEDVIAAIIPSERAVISGDFNTRIGEFSPIIGGVQVARVARDL